MNLRFESRHEPLLSRRRFLLRVATFFAIGVLLYAVSITIGMLGFHYFERISWMGAALNASMIMTGNGPITAMKSFDGRIFQMIYAVFGGLVFVLVVSVLLAPVIHRILHAYHLEPGDGQGGASSLDPRDADD